MNDSIYRISLDMHECIVQKSLKVKKNDNARVLKISLVDNGKIFEIAEGCVATFRAKKPDGTVLFNNCTIENNVITYELTNQTSAVVGEVECEVTLYDSDNKQITSPRFSLAVTDTLYDDNEIESQDEFNQLGHSLTEARVIKVETEQFKNLASNYADASAISATNAEQSELKAMASQTSASMSAINAKQSENIVKASELNAKASEDNAKKSADDASESATSASASVSAVASMVRQASESEIKAKASATNAKMSESSAKASEIKAKTSENLAKTSEDNAKTSEENVNEAYEEILALIGSITDVPVTGVKGDAEEEYREGQVNITKENIGLGNVPNVTTDNQTPTFTKASSDAELVSGETLSTTLGKIARIVSSLISHKGDGNIHVTNSDKEEWNGHIADEDIHVTIGDKENWSKGISDNSLGIATLNNRFNTFATTFSSQIETNTTDIATNTSAISNLDTNKQNKPTRYSASNNATVDIPIVSAKQFRIDICTVGSAEGNCVVTGGSTSGGSVMYNGFSSKYTVTKSTNKLTVKNSAGGNAYFYLTYLN